eukprot:TRINITY_DN22687_c0_g1_i1.p1 TRINITY_DN22687_c0_g1~~TRINITY_DN22687_c0_g1_i1.p1  ORF type:complete len:908 (+),score=215.21 TRINITY_DN22687_c0_g1_i1:357-3080(+)
MPSSIFRRTVAFSFSGASQSFGGSASFSTSRSPSRSSLRSPKSRNTESFGSGFQLGKGKDKDGSKKRDGKDGSNKKEKKSKKEDGSKKEGGSKKEVGSKKDRSSNSKSSRDRKKKPELSEEQGETEKEKNAEKEQRDENGESADDTENKWDTEDVDGSGEAKDDETGSEASGPSASSKRTGSIDGTSMSFASGSVQGSRRNSSRSSRRGRRSNLVPGGALNSSMLFTKSAVDNSDDEDEEFSKPPELEQEEFTVYELVVHIQGARNLMAADFGSKSDPFVVLEVQDKPLRLQSETAHHTLEPVWDFTCTLPDITVSDVINFSVLDEDFMSDQGDLLGKYTLPVKDLMQTNDDGTLEFCGYAGPLTLEVPGQENDPQRPIASLVSRQACIVVNISVNSAVVSQRDVVAEEWGLLINIVGASELRNADILGTSDPVCECKVRDTNGKEKHSFCTGVVDGSLNPVWEHEEFISENVEISDTLEFSIYDDDNGARELLGKVVVTREHFWPDGVDEELPIVGTANEEDGRLRLFIEVLNERAVERHREFLEGEEQLRLAKEKAEEEYQESLRREREELEKEQNAYKAEPLHVRAMLRQGLRLAKEELAAKQKELNVLEEAFARGDTETQVRALRNDAGNLSKSDKGKEDKFEDKTVPLEDEIRRCKYRLKMLESRLQRLREVDIWRFGELPMQCLAAAREGDAEYVHFCYLAGVDLDIQDDLGVTPLIAAAVENKVSVVRTLVADGADTRMQDQNGATCAHYAVLLRHIHVVSALLEGGCFDVFTVKDVAGMSAIDYARHEDRDAYFRHIRSQMGGPGSLLLHIFKGWLLDSLSVPRQTKAFFNLFRTRCDQAIEFGKKAQPIIESCQQCYRPAPHQEEQDQDYTQAVQAGSNPRGAKARAAAFRQRQQGKT